MNRLQTTLALCLLGLLAASLADETAQTEQVNDGLEREAREVSDDVNTDVDRYEDMMTRNKRHARDLLCGLCHWGEYVQPPCHRFKRISYRTKRRCGWWRRRHWCTVTRHRIVFQKYCCSRAILMWIPLTFPRLHVCVDLHIPCGGFAKNVPSERVCKIYVKVFKKTIKFCSPRYGRRGDVCYRR